MRLILLHPDIAARSCSDCQKYLYLDRGPGQFGKRVERAGIPTLRPKGVKTPCMWCPKIPPGVKPIPTNAVEMDDKAYAAYLHYLECKAVGGFPHDAIVRRNAAIIRQAEDAAERMRQTRSGHAMIQGLRGVL